MKNRLFYSFFLCIFLTFFSSRTFCQQTLINLDGWNCYVHLPDDYNKTTQNYPTIIFFPGVGEIGTNASLVISHGPGAYLQGGWNGNVGDVKFIVVSIQPVEEHPVVTFTKAKVDLLKSKYRIGDIWLTGLSRGAWNSLQLSFSYLNDFRGVVGVESQPSWINHPGDGAAQYSQNIIDTYRPVAKAGQRYVLYHNVGGQSRSDEIVNAMNGAVPGSATYLVRQHGTGHTGWDYVYGDKSKQPEVFPELGDKTIYEWIADEYKRITINPPNPKIDAPVINLAESMSSTTPVITITSDITWARGHSGTFLWEKKSGDNNVRIVNPANKDAEIEGLRNGNYTFRLTVTQDDNQSVFKEINVVVNIPENDDCGCDVVFDPVNNPNIDIKGTSAAKIVPGTVICLKAGHYQRISFDGLQGTKDKRITIKNCGGQVLAYQVDPRGMFRVVNSRFVHVTGTGDPNYFYGIQAGGEGASANFSFGGIITDLEIDHVEGLKASSGWGMQLKTNPADYDSLTWHPYGSINNISIHDTKMANTNAEGYYIGYTNSNIPVKARDKSGNVIDIKVEPVFINGLEFYNNIAIHTGWDGIQIAHTRGFDVHDCEVYDYGKSEQGAQNLGYIIGGGSNGNFYNNIADGGSSSGLQFLGSNEDAPPSLIYNNIIANTGWDGMTFADRPNEEGGGMYHSQQYYIYNNTIVNVVRTGVMLLNAYGTVADGNRFYNNLIVGAAGSVNLGQDMKLKVDTSDNVFFKTTAEAGLISGTYKLSPSSPAYNITGKNGSQFFKDDFEHKDREGVYSIGAYRTSADGNTVPIVDAGENRTVETDTVILKGSAQPPKDRKIISFEWTKKSGPASSSIGDSGSAETTVFELTEGTYIFELKAEDDKGSTGTATVKITVTPKNIPPKANAGEDITITLPLNYVNLNGAGTDNDGTVTGYKWIKKSGPETFKIEAPSSAKTKISNLVEGIYTFELTVTDNKGATGTAAVKVIVNPYQNVAPEADAGKDAVITLPVNSVNLNGKGNDSDGEITGYNWTKKSGPADFSIETPNSAQTKVSGLVEGIYVFELKVTDNDGAIGSASVKITVNPRQNTAPKASAGNDISVTLPVNSVSLTGSGTDADGEISGYKWTKKSGPESYTIESEDAARTGVSNLTEGIYVFELTVTDNEGATGSATVKVIVNKANNKAPKASAGDDITITLPGNTVTLRGSGTDEDGEVVSYEWTRRSGPSSYNIVNLKSPITDVTGLVQGTYVFELTVIDDEGSVGTATVKIIVNPAVNKLPVANAGNDITIVLPENSVSLQGSGSDPDGSIVGYRWARKSGPLNFKIEAPASANTIVTGLTEGVYEFQLTVTDDRDGTAASVVTVTVKPAINTPPTVSAGNNQEITLPVNTVSLKGSASDPDGEIALLEWSKKTGPGSFKITSPNSLNTTITGLNQGDYVFELKATDNKGATATSTVKVTVNPSKNIPPVADAGKDQVVSLPQNKVVLRGNGTDEDGIIVSFNWIKKSGPSGFKIADPASAVTDVTNLIEGVYVFELTVRDDNGAVASALVKVTVNPKVNKAPSVSVGKDINLMLPDNSTSLTGSASDPDGEVVSYQWTKTAGPSNYSFENPTSTTTRVSGLVEGSYTFQLKVTDNDGASATAKIKVNVGSLKKDPIAAAGSDLTVMLPEDSVMLRGNGQAENGGTIVSYQWTQISGPKSANIITKQSAETPVKELTVGEYSFVLIVTDNQGSKGKDTINVIVESPLVAPFSNAFRVFPNPTANYVTLQIDGKLPDEKMGILLTNMSGSILMRRDLSMARDNVYTEKIDMTIYGNGTYVITLIDSKGKIYTSKTVIKIK